MATATQTLFDASQPLRKQRSMKFSLSRTKSPESCTPPRTPATPETSVSDLPPRLPPLPSLAQGLDRLAFFAGSSPPRPSTSHETSPSRSLSPSQSPAAADLPERPSTASRIKALRESLRSPSVTGRTTPESPSRSVENFSRPRPPSCKKRNGTAPVLTSHATSFPIDLLQTSSTDDPARHRGYSSSSQRSAATCPAPPIRSMDSLLDLPATDVGGSTRPRHQQSLGYRSLRGLSRVENGFAPSRREVKSRPYNANVEDEQAVRASFRSALTTGSSYLANSGTERSSVLTKSSSATSIYGGKDEGMSVDDAIGMYEVGFYDTGPEDSAASRAGTRPGTSTSLQQRAVGQSDSADQINLSDLPSRNDLTLSLKGIDGSLEASTTPQSPIESLARQQSQQTILAMPPRPLPHNTMPARLHREETGRFDRSRDRYGFRKKSQHVSEAQYNAWSGPYKEHLARRRRKWEDLMRESKLSSENPIQFPAQTAKVKRFVRKGIPPDWRGNAWFFYAGGPLLLARHRGVYDELVRKIGQGGVNETDNEIIERDLHRTFPDNIKFKPDAPEGQPMDSPDAATPPETSTLKALRRVLQTFSMHNPRIGYCQSLNFLAGMLLLFMDEEKAFWMLNQITSKYLPNTHEVNLEGANVDLGVLMTSIKESMPQVWAKIGGELDGSAGDGRVSMRLPPITLCTTPWFMSCYIGTLPIETTLRVWDCFFYEGSKTLFRIALAIFKVGEQEIRAVNDPMEIFQVVQCIPRKLVDANALMEACFKRRNGFGHLSQETIDARRAERRAGYAEERARTAGASTAAGGSTDAHPAASMAPMLGKKKPSFYRKISKQKTDPITLVPVA